MSEVETVTDADLRAHCCLEAVDLVPGDAETTAFKRRARLHQALWRESRGLPIGSQPMRPKPGQSSRPLGSRIAVDAVRERLADPQRRETLDEDRLYCDLLSSMPMCFNLFGALQADLASADRAVHAWWPDVPGRVGAVRFEWSPGRALPGEYLENRSAFDVAFVLELSGGGRGVLGVETKYHEHCRREKAPGDGRLGRYRKVDTDGDGLRDPEELWTYGTDPADADTDHDGLNDGDEILTYHTDAHDPDSDNDGLKDGEEVHIYKTDPLDFDSDNDAIPDGVEVHTYGTNPVKADSDGDMLGDWLEIFYYGTDPNDADSDHDFLTDGEEILLYFCNPRDADTDNDNLYDGIEVLVYGTNPNCADTDGDGLSDGLELFLYLTDPNNTDTDGDGMLDGDEITADTDPSSAWSLLRITGVAQALSGGVRIYWTGGVRATQYIERTAALTSTVGQWTVVATNRPPTPVTNHVIDAGTTNGLMFYRIKARR